MSKIFPIRSERDLDLDDPRIVELGSEDAEVFLDALSSKTTRDVFVEIYKEASTISDLSNEFDDTIQNIKYHIEKLEESKLIETTGTDYSEKGNEMDVYAPTNEALVLVVGTEESKKKILDKIKPVGAFVIVSAAVSAAIGYATSIKSEVTNQDPQVDDVTSDPQVGIRAESNDKSNDIAANSEVETTKEILIGDIALPVDIAIPLIAILCLLIGAICYRFTVGRS